MSKKFRGWGKMNAPRKPANLDQPATQQNRDFGTSSWHASAPEEAEVFPPASVTVPSTSPITEARLLANRANALLSTGAVTPEGKQIVSQNATKQGLTGTFFVLPGESQEDFDQLLVAYMKAEKPADQEETDMVKCMAEATWLSRRSVRLQDRCIVTIESGTPAEQKAAERQLSLYLRYMTTHDRAYDRYANVLRKRRAERRRVERGFVSQKHREAAEARRVRSENRKNELHQLRQETIILRQQRVEINNRIAAAKAERLEQQNGAAKTAPKTTPALAAAA